MPSLMSLPPERTTEMSAMTHKVYVTGRKDPMVFDRWTTADYYRSVIMRDTGRFAWVVSS